MPDNNVPPTRNDGAGRAEVTGGIADLWPLALLIVAASSVAALFSTVVVTEYGIDLGSLGEWAIAAVGLAALVVVGRRLGAAVR